MNGTARLLPRSNSMNGVTPSWLLVNSRSGSNTDAAIDALHSCCARSGFEIKRQIAFPEEDLPTLEDLDDAGIARLVVFTGDGTLNAAITTLYGWGGEIVVLPGGTMNLLCKRLHEDAELDTIVERIASGAYRRIRPLVARCEKGDAMAGLLAGPGTAWASVREAMRDFDLSGMAEGTGDALAETTGGSMVRCLDPNRGHNDGYPLLEFTPGHRGLQLDAFHAEHMGELLQQGFALLRRNFRQGPHTRLGLSDRFVLQSADGTPIEILIDGEPATLPSRATFEVAPCEVDLLATAHGF